MAENTPKTPATITLDKPVVVLASICGVVLFFLLSVFVDSPRWLVALFQFFAYAGLAYVWFEATAKLKGSDTVTLAAKYAGVGIYGLLALVAFIGIFSWKALLVVGGIAPFLLTVPFVVLVYAYFEGKLK